MYIELTEQERKYVIAALNRDIETVNYETSRIRQPKTFDPNKARSRLLFYKEFMKKLGA